MNYAADKSSRGLSLLVTENGSNQASSVGPGVARIDHEILLDSDKLNTYRYEGWEAVHGDLLMVCAAVEYCDRQCPRPPSRWSRDFHLTVPVKSLESWNRAGVSNLLESVLRALTGDAWTFSFVPAKAKFVRASRQLELDFFDRPQFVIPYSDGLDSRCVSALFEAPIKGVLVRVGGRNSARRNYNPYRFHYIPFSVRPPSPKETSVRSRAFKFASAAAIAATLIGVTRVIVPESGQGALGPAIIPLLRSYPDYRNHPSFFRKMEKFLELLLDHPVEYEQPRLWKTKSQTIAEALEVSGVGEDMLVHSRSCWQQRWNACIDDARRQCGLCSACLLRRMSFCSAQISEPSDAYVYSDLSAHSYTQAVPKAAGWQPTKSMLGYACVAVRQLQQLADLAGAKDSELGPHVFELARDTRSTQEETLTELKRLLVQHQAEWSLFLAKLGSDSFVREWAVGVGNG